MKRTALSLAIAAFGLAITTMSTALAAPPAVGPGPAQPVQVTNTPAAPVPVTVQGSMTVSGNVQVTNTPNVAIVNNSANPVLVQQAGMPYSADKVGTCNGTNCFIDFPEVPAGKQLVIVYLSAVARPTAQTTIFDFAELEASDTAEPQFATRYTFPMARIGQAGASVIADTYGVNTPLLAFVNAGQIPHLTLAQRTNGEVFFSQATISGYLVSVTQ